MPTEIERKFLVEGDDWRAEAERGQRITQGYLTAERGPVSVRVRLVDGAAGYLTLKTSRSGLSRAEYEYVVPPEEARELLDLCNGALIDKTRHLVRRDGHVWEVDVFHGANDGLVIAEIELDSEDDAFEPPGWLGQEVTGLDKFYNRALTLEPFCDWPRGERAGGVA